MLFLKQNNFVARFARKVCYLDFFVISKHGVEKQVGMKNSR